MVSKKGSMELGVNAIVVLIIALVILGLGIGFVTKVLGGATDKVTGIVETTELPIHADSSQPIKFEKTQFNMKSGKTENLKLSLYNTGEYLTNDLKAEMTSCTNQDGVEFTPDESISLVSVTQTIDISTEGGYEVILTSQPYDSTTCPASGFCKGAYICNVKVSGGASGGSKSAQLIIDMVN